MDLSRALGEAIFLSQLVSKLEKNWESC